MRSRSLWRLKMTSKEIKALERALVKEPKCKYVKVSVFIVQKCNFNDEFLIDTKWLEVSSLADRPLEWFDPYLGRNPRSSLMVALACVDGDKVYFLEKTGGNVRVIKKGLYSHTYSDDYDDTKIIASHIDTTYTKW